MLCVESHLREAAGDSLQARLVPWFLRSRLPCGFCSNELELEIVPAQRTHGLVSLRRSEYDEANSCR